MIPPRLHPAKKAATVPPMEMSFETETTTPNAASRGWTFRVEIKPRGKARAKPRVMINKKSTGPAYNIWWNTPKATLEAQKEIAKAARAVGVKPIDGPVNIQVLALFATPPSLGDAEKEKRISGNAWHTMRPDDDNIAKLVRDALNGIAYKDDAQVCGGGGVVKRWVDGESMPSSLTVSVWQLPD